MRPVLFLDIDGVCNGWTGNEADLHPEYFGALCRVPGATEFFRWAVGRFEVRWLTAWSVNNAGAMREERVPELAWLLGVEEDEIRAVRSAPWDGTDKTTGIRAVIGESGREWIWLDDDRMERELASLEAMGATDRLIHVDCLKDVRALEKAHAGLARTFP
jgi:hypothetical protein